MNHISGASAFDMDTLVFLAPSRQSAHPLNTFQYSLPGGRWEVRQTSDEVSKPPPDAGPFCRTQNEQVMGLSRNRRWTDRGGGGSVLSLRDHWSREQQESCDDRNRWVAGPYLGTMGPVHRGGETVWGDEEWSKAFQTWVTWVFPLCFCWQSIEWIEFVIMVSFSIAGCQILLTNLGRVHRVQVPALIFKTLSSFLYIFSERHWLPIKWGTFIRLSS